MGVGRTGGLTAGGARGLALACHPLPAAAVTVLTTVLAAAAGTRGPILGLLAAAVLAGPLCVGWTNDLVDRDRDRAVGRLDKPLALDLVSAPAVRAPAVGAGGRCGPPLPRLRSR